MGLMSDLGSGLKEFSQNFVLSAGTQIAENIKKKAEEERKDVRDHVKLLRANIAKNKANKNDRGINLVIIFETFRNE